MNNIRFYAIITTCLFLAACGKEREVFDEGMKRLNEVREVAATCVKNQPIDLCQIKMNDYLAQGKSNNLPSPFGIQPILLNDQVNAKAEIRLQFSDHVPEPLKGRQLVIQDVGGNAACIILNPGKGFDKHLGNCKAATALSEPNALGFIPIEGAAPYNGKTPPIISSAKNN